MTKSLVVDTSFTVELVLSDDQSSEFWTLLADWRANGYRLCAPTLWIYETTSTLSKLVRFREISLASAREALALVHELGVQLIPPDEYQAALAFEWTLRLNRASAYDSFYLALAESLQAELWTADRRLRNAVNLPWIRMADEG